MAGAIIFCIILKYQIAILPFHLTGPSQLHLHYRDMHNSTFAGALFIKPQPICPNTTVIAARTPTVTLMVLNIETL